MAVGLMLLWHDDFRAIFWLVVTPGLAVRSNPLRRDNVRRLGAGYLWVVVIGALFTQARFSEAFLVLRAQQTGIPLPQVMVAMNQVYALSVNPFGRISDAPASHHASDMESAGVDRSRPDPGREAPLGRHAGGGGTVGRAHGDDPGAAGRHGTR
ncbi:hypothetical protein ACWIJ6_08720 [Aeromonas piscicola]